MGARISSLLVQRGLVSVSDLQDALASQVVRGGTLDTALLERKLISEADVVGLLAETSGTAPWKPEMLGWITPALAVEISLEQADQHGVVPLRRRKNELEVLCTEATDQRRVAHLASELGCHVAPVAAPQIRFAQARSVIYGVALPQRFERLLASLQPAAQPAEGKTSDTPAVTTPQPVRDASKTPVIAHHVALPATATTTLHLAAEAEPLATTELPDPTAATDDASEKDDASQSTDGASLGLDEIQQRLEVARDRDEVLTTLLRGVIRHVGHAALFVVREDTLDGLYAISDGHIDTASIRRAHISRGTSSALARVVRTGAPFIGPVPEDDNTGVILLSADILASHLALLPITIRDRVVCLVVAHQQTPITDDSQQALKQLLQLATQALMAVVVRRKRETARAMAARRRQVTAPSLVPGQVDSVTAKPQPPRETAPIANASRSPQFAPPQATSTDVARDLERARCPTAPAKAAIPSSAVSESKVVVAFDVAVATMSTAELISALEAGSHDTRDVLDELRRHGDEAVSALVERFPGQLSTEPQEPETLPPAVDCSRVIEALVHLGRATLPKLAPVLVHGDESSRFFGTYLLSQMPYPEAVAMLAARVSDSSSSVRSMAIYALQQARRLPSFADVLDELRSDLSHPEPLPQRGAMLALGALGDVLSGPSLIASLRDNRQDVAQAARQALTLLTLQDFGTDISRWHQWWRQHRTNARTEWLTQALEHPSKEIRELAALELRSAKRISDDSARPPTTAATHHDDTPTTKPSSGRRDSRRRKRR